MIQISMYLPTGGNLIQVVNSSSFKSIQSLGPVYIHKGINIKFLVGKQE